MRENCEDVFDTIGCTAAFQYCQNLVFLPFLETGRNPYDVTKVRLRTHASSRLSRLGEFLLTLRRRCAMRMAHRMSGVSPFETA